MKGLSARDAAEALARHGPNELPSQGRRSGWRIAAEVAGEPMFLLLLACGALYVLLGDPGEAAMLFAAVLGVVGLTFWQERKTERALEALRDLSSPRALVLRDGLPVRVPGREVVPGDELLLEEGDRVPADAVVLESAGLACDESLLTGESVPVPKSVWDGAAPLGRPGGDDAPFVWSGTLVVRGRGRAMAKATGPRTEMGRIGASLSSLVPEQTALHKESARLVRFMGAAAFAACLVIAAVYGLARGSWTQGLLAGLTLAMSLVPEEFPVILTVFLALGAWRMSARRVLARRAAAIEALGSATILCSDKTGTLTQNKMTVTRAEPAPGEGDERALLRLAALASREDPVDPMERAFHEAGGVAPAAEGLTLEKEYPLESSRMARVWRDASGARHAAAKGAPEAVLELCGAPPVLREAALARLRELGAGGLRVIGVAEARAPEGPLPARVEALSWRWAGLTALADPLRPSAREAVAMCRAAGLRVLIVTGDHPATALGVARELGLLEGPALTGADIAGLDAAGLTARLRDAVVAARVLPEQKLQVVRALQAAGEVVAMTGDGVNDAPALKAADIGVAMGGRGSDVAREAAGVVLLDDDFATLVAGVREGRRIFDNIRKAMAFVVAVHIPIAGIALAAAAAGWPLILMPVHILFLEMVIDPACTVVFEADPEEGDLMARPPRPPLEPILGREALVLSVLRGAVAFAAAFGAALWGMAQGWSEGRVRAAAFTVIVLLNLTLIVASLCGRRGLRATLATPNPALRWTFAGAGLMLALALGTPFLRGVFHFDALGGAGLAAAALAAAAGQAAVLGLGRLYRMKT
ncbi:MAG: cation-translocating P-type ATPase [Elusimicrobiota bacterium]|nr:cation-translocating P-type ATPase [Elusimicrobiota bacterium]